MKAVEPDALAEAILIGARRYGHDSGHTYRRRRLTTKQRKLIALLADGDAAGTDEFAKTFPDEWNSILKAHPDREPGQQREALFENFADVASRINAYLLAGYKDTVLRARMAALLGGQLVAIGASFADRELFTVGGQELKELLPAMTVTKSLRKRARPAGAAAVPTAPQSEAAPSPLPEPSVPQAPTGVPPAVDAAVNASTLDLAPTSPPSESASATPDPSPPPPQQTDETTAEPIAATVNPVTLRWTLFLPEGEIEADPRLGTVRLGSSIRNWYGDPLPEDPERLTAQQLALLRKMVS